MEITTEQPIKLADPLDYQTAILLSQMVWESHPELCRCERCVVIAKLRARAEEERSKQNSWLAARNHGQARIVAEMKERILKMDRAEENTERKPSLWKRIFQAKKKRKTKN